MRTTILIDEKLMQAALKSTGVKTKREVVELGLKALLLLSKQSELKEFRGKLAWKGDLEDMRRD